MLLCCYFIENILTRKKSFKELSNFRKPFEKFCELLSGGSGTFDSGKNFLQIGTMEKKTFKNDGRSFILANNMYVYSFQSPKKRIIKSKVLGYNIWSFLVFTDPKHNCLRGFSQ